MKGDYREILEVMGAPKWWNEHGSPRYVDFAPNESANIYAVEVVLALITCQSCGHEFHVCFSQGQYEMMESARSLASYIKDHDLHYGDPPNADCCLAGPTMNSVPMRVLEFWSRELGNTKDGWTRHPEFELDIQPDWWTDEQGPEELADLTAGNTALR